MSPKKKPRTRDAPPESAFFGSPWSEATDKTRNQLLIVAMLGVLMAAAGIFPKDIEALGLKIEDINQRALLIVFAVVVTYLTLTFALHTYSDFLRGYWTIFRNVESRLIDEDENADLREAILASERMKGQLMNVHYIRLLFDAGVPSVAGLVSAIWLVWRATHLVS